jgi:hypothetical protein
VFRFRATGNTTQFTLQDVSANGDVTDLLVDQISLTLVDDSGETGTPDESSPTPPVLGMVGGASGVVLTLDVGSAGSYRIETSQDLVGWEPLQTIDATAAGRHSIEDAGPLPERRYYRVAWQTALPGP